MVVPGDSAKSLLVAAAAQIDDKIAMPPKHRPGRPGGPGGPGAPPPGSTPDAGPPPNTPPPGGPGGPHHRPSKPLTPDQVGLVRAWIDQGAN
jgi:hypothetical protein